MDVDLDILRPRSQFYAERCGVSKRMQGTTCSKFRGVAQMIDIRQAQSLTWHLQLSFAGKLAAFLSSEFVKDLLHISDEVLRSDLILDAYK